MDADNHLEEIGRLYTGMGEQTQLEWVAEQIGSAMLESYGKDEP